MIFESVDQLKEFISWCSQNGVTQFQSRDASFVVAPSMSSMPVEVDVDSKPADAIRAALAGSNLELDLLYKRGGQS